MYSAVILWVKTHEKKLERQKDEESKDRFGKMCRELNVSWSFHSYSCHTSFSLCLYLSIDLLLTNSGPVYTGQGQIFAQTKTCTLPPCVYTRAAELDKLLNG